MIGQVMFQVGLHTVQAVSQAVPLPGGPPTPTFDLHIPSQLSLALGPDIVLFIGTMAMMLWCRVAARQP